MALIVAVQRKCVRDLVHHACCGGGCEVLQRVQLQLWLAVWLCCFVCCFPSVLSVCNSNPVFSPDFESSVLNSSKPVLRAFLADTGNSDAVCDNAFNAGAWQGFIDFASSFPQFTVIPVTVGPVKVVPAYSAFNATNQFFSPCFDIGSCVKEFSPIADQFDVFFFLGFDYDTTVTILAQQFPESLLVILDDAPVNTYKNLLSAVFSTDQAAFLAGMVAGQVASLRQRGTICFGGVASTPVRVLCAGFQSGVAYSCPSCRTYTAFLNSFEWSDQYFQSAPNFMQQLGIDVAFGAGGSAGLASIIGAVQANNSNGQPLYAIGVDFDTYYNYSGSAGFEGTWYSNRILTSTVKQLNTAVAKILTDMVHGHLTFGIIRDFNWENGGVSLAPCHEACNVSGYNATDIMTASFRFSSGLLATGVDLTGLLSNPNDAAQLLTPTLIQSASVTPPARSGAALTTLNQLDYDILGDQIFLFGGLSSSSGPLQDMWLFDLGENSWLPRRSGLLLTPVISTVIGNLGAIVSTNNAPSAILPPVLYEHTITALIDSSSGIELECLVIFGGSTLNGSNVATLNDLFIYVLTPQQYGPIAMASDLIFHVSFPDNLPQQFPQPLTGHSATSLGALGASYANQMLVFGGQINGNTPTNQLWRFTLGTLAMNYTDSAWQRIITSSSALPAPAVSQHTAVLISGVLLIFGGVTNSYTNQPQNTLFGYNVSGNKWSQRASAPGPRADHATVIVKNMTINTSAASGYSQPSELLMLVTGGFSVSPTTPDTSVHTYSLVRDEWKDIGLSTSAYTCKTGRMRHSAVSILDSTAITNRVFLYGGIDGTNDLNDLCFFDYVWMSVARIAYIPVGSTKPVNTLPPQVSGDFFTYLSISLLDSSNNLALDTNNLVVTATTSQGTLTGTTRVSVSNTTGQADFSKLAIIYIPGQAANITFTLSGPGITMNSALVITLTVQIAACDYGNQLTLQRTCTQCAICTPCASGLTTRQLNGQYCVSPVAFIAPISIPCSNLSYIWTNNSGNGNSSSASCFSPSIVAGNFLYGANLVGQQSGGAFQPPLIVRAYSLTPNGSIKPLSGSYQAQITIRNGNLVLPYWMPSSYVQFIDGTLDLTGVGIQYMPGMQTVLTVHIVNVPEVDAAMLEVTVKFSDSPLHSMSVSTQGVVWTFLGVSMAAVLAAGCGVLYFHMDRVIFAFSPSFLLLNLLGIFLALISAVLQMLPPTAASCTASTWLFNIGFTLAYSAVLVKTYRLYRIFLNPIFSLYMRLRDRDLMVIVSIWLLFDVVVLIMWQTISPYVEVVNEYRSCESSHADVFRPLLISSKGLVVLCGAWLTYQVRDIPSQFNESRSLAVALYNTIIISCIVLIIWLAVSGSNYIAEQLVISIGTLIGCVSTLCVLFVPVFIAVIVEKKGQLAFDQHRSGKHNSPPRNLSFASPEDFEVRGPNQHQQQRQLSMHEGSISLFDINVDLEALERLKEQLEKAPVRHLLVEQSLMLINEIKRAEHKRLKFQREKNRRVSRLQHNMNEITYLQCTPSELKRRMALDVTFAAILPGTAGRATSVDIEAKQIPGMQTNRRPSLSVVAGRTHRFTPRRDSFSGQTGPQNGQQRIDSHEPQTATNTGGQIASAAVSTARPTLTSMDTTQRVDPNNSHEPSFRSHSQFNRPPLHFTANSSSAANLDRDREGHLLGPEPASTPSIAMVELGSGYESGSGSFQGMESRRKTHENDTNIVIHLAYENAGMDSNEAKADVSSLRRGQECLELDSRHLSGKALPNDVEQRL